MRFEFSRFLAQINAQNESLLSVNNGRPRLSCSLLIVFSQIGLSSSRDRYEIGIHAYRGQSDAISCTRGLHRICDNPPFDEQILTLGN